MFVAVVQEVDASFGEPVLAFHLPEATPLRHLNSRRKTPPHAVLLVSPLRQRRRRLSTTQIRRTQTAFRWCNPRGRCRHLADGFLLLEYSCPETCAASPAPMPVDARMSVQDRHTAHRSISSGLGTTP